MTSEENLSEQGSFQDVIVMLWLMFLGMQHYVIEAAQPYGLGLNETIMPQYFKKLGYATHIVGKVYVDRFEADFVFDFLGLIAFYADLLLARHPIFWGGKIVWWAKNKLAKIVKYWIWRWLKIEISSELKAR